MPQILETPDFLIAPGPMLDVRSPSEYRQGHIPGAVNFPLFSDLERAEVGICFKQAGQEEAIALGLELVGTKMAGFVRTAKQLAPLKKVRLHCWRGGMRSSSMGWLLETAGMEVTLLAGGYKAFRQWLRYLLAIPKPIITLGGMTGTQKTAILQALAERQELVLDLEKLANHRGSSYGALGFPPQPSTEHFENLVAIAWHNLNPIAGQSIWIEAESRGIGTCRIPIELYEQMLKSPIIEVVRSPQKRIQYLEQEYGNADPDLLIVATQRIGKRLGSQRTEAAIQAIQTGNLAVAIAISLEYYDRAYQFDLARREVPIRSVMVADLTPNQCADLLLKLRAETFPG